MPSLADKHRPRQWADVAGQGKAIAKIDNLRKRGLGGRAYWLAGPSGTGKTTIAYLLAGEVAGEWGTEELDSSGLTPKDIQLWEAKVSRRCMFGPGGWALVVNEAHGLQAHTIRQLLTTIDRLPGHVIVVFTTTMQGQQTLFDGKQDASPLFSRCAVPDMDHSGPEVELSFACRLRQVAQAEGIDGHEITDYLRLVRAEKFNLRSCLQRIDAGAW